MKTMHSFEVVRVLTGLDGSADISSMDRETVTQFLVGLGQGRSLIAALEAEAVTRLAEIESSVAAEAVLASGARLAPGQARAVVQRAEAITAMPYLGASLEDGVITPEHVDAVARGLKRLGEKSHLLVDHQDRLVAQAMYLTVPRFSKWVDNVVAMLDERSENDTFEHQRRSAYVRLWEDHRSGMIRLTGQIDPETGARLWTILDAHVDAMFHGAQPAETAEGIEENDHRRAHALCDLVEAGSAHVGEPGAESRVNTEVIVTIDLETLMHGVHPDSVRRTAGGVDLPVDVVRRMACDAGLVPMVLNGDGVVVDVGREKRLATKRQRRAIFAMHETCAAPHCGVKVTHCVPHHIDWWENGGGTELSNLVPLCSRHHHAVHEGGWRLTMDTRRRVTMTPPDHEPGGG